MARKKQFWYPILYTLSVFPKSFLFLPSWRQWPFPSVLMCTLWLVNMIPAAQIIWSTSKWYSWCILGTSRTSSKVSDLELFLVYFSRSNKLLEGLLNLDIGTLSIYLVSMIILSLNRNRDVDLSLIFVTFNSIFNSIQFISNYVMFNYFDSKITL